MGLTGIVLNNLTELFALGIVFLLGYWTGRLVQKHLPHHHLRPWKWGTKRA